MRFDGFTMMTSRSLRIGLLLLFAHQCSSADVQVFFSPQGGCTAAVVGALNSARSNVLVQAYSFTSTNIASALVNASRRGVKVTVVLDSSNEKDGYSAATFVSNMGIPTLIDKSHSIAHNKVMIIDGATVITGSFNFTKAAEDKNAENLLIIRDAAITMKYSENWWLHANHSYRYKPSVR